MKNLAGVEECDIDIRKELEAAGIEVKQIERASSEVPHSLVGQLGVWTFSRAWRYWVAMAPSGKGIPEGEAVTFNSRWYDQVRVAGFAGGTKVEPRWLSSNRTIRTIDVYHIDTQEGLNVFAALVRKLLAEHGSRRAKSLERERHIAEREAVGGCCPGCTILGQ